MEQKNMKYIIRRATDELGTDGAGAGQRRAGDMDAARGVADALQALLPSFRAFARGICGSAAQGDFCCEKACIEAFDAYGDAALPSNFSERAFQILRRICRASAPPTSEFESSVLASVTALPIDEREAVTLVTGLGFGVATAARICETTPAVILSRLAAGTARLGAHP